jgi:outer membrane immunogenic protein
MKFSWLSVAAIAQIITFAAYAADLPPAPNYVKAPAPVMTPSWTGFYLFGGAGGGLWAADTTIINTATGVCIGCINQRQGGSGYFGTVGGGYDWQFNQSWVAGVFGDGQFGSISGSIQDANVGLVGTEKLRTSWAAGVRLGYLVAPNVLSYVNGGYSESSWSGTNLVSTINGAPSLLATPSFNRNGFFFGGGVENNLNIFGITAPGWFVRTEYRAAFYSRISLPETIAATGAPFGEGFTFKPWDQTISTSLVYRFN